MPDMAFRMRAPLGVTLRDGTRTRVEDWSMRGISAPGLMDKDVTDAVLAIPFQGVVLSFPIKLHPADEPDFYEFREMNGRQRETLALFYRNLLTGKMASTADMITSLDTPVDLVPMGETDEERDRNSGSKTRRMLRSAGSLLMYVVLFGLVFGYLGNLAWQRLNTIDLSQPRFVAAIETLSTPMPSFVERVRIEPGQAANAGEILVLLNDPELQAEMDQVRFEVRGAENARDQVQSRIESIQGEQSNERAQLLARHQDALAKLDSRDFVQGRHRSLPTATELANYDQKAAALEASGVLAQLRNVETERLQTLRLLRRERNNIAKQMQALNIRAPFTGTVSEYFVQKGQFLRTGAPIVAFESDVARHVRGWVDDRLAGDVYIGMPATITFNIGGEFRDVAGMVTDLQAGVNPEQPDRYGSVVTVEATELTSDETHNLFTNNAPAQVALDRGLFKRLFGDDG